LTIWDPARQKLILKFPEEQGAICPFVWSTDGNLLAAGTSTMLSLAGDVTMLFSAGKVIRRWKGPDWSHQTVLRYNRRSAGGRSKDPHDLISALNVHEYRSLPGRCVPPNAPTNYVPLVRSDFHEGAVKLLKVPMN
jgi:hypothetical protein